MAYEEKYKEEAVHHISMEGREKLSVSGATDVESFDENAVVMDTCRGLLIVKGENLHMEKLSLDVGEVFIEGKINSLEYEDTVSSSGGFFARLFK